MGGTVGEPGLKDGGIGVKGDLCSTRGWTASKGLERTEWRTGASGGLEMASCAGGVGQAFETFGGSECRGQNRFHSGHHSRSNMAPCWPAAGLAVVLGVLGYRAGSVGKAARVAGHCVPQGDSSQMV